MRVSVLRVDRRGDGADRVEQEPLDLAEQAHAVQRHAGVVADRGEELEILLAEAAGAALAIDVERAENLVGRPERHAHHRSDALSDDAVAAREPCVDARVPRERRDALGDRVGDDACGSA